MADRIVTVAVGGGKDYVSLNAALSAQKALYPNLTVDNGSGSAGRLIFECYAGTGPDTVLVATISGWTTDASNYLVLRGAASEKTAFTRNKYSTARYRHEPSSDGSNISCNQSYTRIYDLQLQVTTASTNTKYGVSIAGSATGCQIYNNIVKNGYAAGTSRTAISFGSLAVRPNYAFNNIIYGFNGATCNGISPGGGTGSGPNLVFNNTIYDCTTGLSVGASQDQCLAINNLCVSCPTPYGTSYRFATGTDYNATDAGAMGYTVNGGAPAHDHPGISTTNLFVDAAGGDFHLTQNATVAVRGAGQNVSATNPPGVTKDIDDETRSGSWDIGADQYLNVCTDTFSGGNANPAPAPWVSNSGGTFSSVMKVENGTLNSSSSDAVSHYGSVFASDQYSKATVGGVAPSCYHYVVVRASATGENFYYLRCYNGTSIGLRKCVSGSLSTLGSDQAVAYANGDVLELRIVGTTLTGYRNGSPIPGVTATDATIASGYPGLGSAGGTYTWDNWEGGDVTSSGGAAAFAPMLTRRGQAFCSRTMTDY